MSFWFLMFQFLQEVDEDLIHRGPEFCATPPHSCVLARDFQVICLQ